MTDDNLETKVEPSRRMEDDPMENNKGAGTVYNVQSNIYYKLV